MQNPLNQNEWRNTEDMRHSCCPATDSIAGPFLSIPSCENSLKDF